MKRTVLAALAAAFLFAGGLLAQDAEFDDQYLADYGQQAEDDFYLVNYIASQSAGSILSGPCASVGPPSWKALCNETVQSWANGLGTKVTPDGTDRVILMNSAASNALTTATVTSLDLGGGGGVSLATDTLWAAKGDVVLGTANNTASIFTAPSNDSGMIADSAQSTGWKAFPPGTTSEIADVAAVESAGTSDTYARGDHVHALAITAAADFGAVAKQSSTPGTAQTGHLNLTGEAVFNRNDIKTTPTYGLELLNATASDVTNTVQMSPSIHYQGSVWDTDGAVSKTMDWRSGLTMTTANVPLSDFAFFSNYAGAGFVQQIGFRHGTASTGGSIQWGTTGGRLDGMTDGVIVKNFANTNTGTLCFAATSATSACLTKQSSVPQLNVVSGDGTGQAAILIQGGHGETATWGSATELLTLDTGATFTDTTANLLPPNSIIESVVTRVTTSITTAVSWTVGDPTTSARFCASAGGMAANNTRVCLEHMSGVVTTAAAGPTQPSTAKVRLTFNANPGAGVVRITVFYKLFVVPTS